MKKLMKAMAGVLAALMMVTPVFAADNELTAEYADGKYTLNMAADALLDIDDLEFGEVYSRTMEVKNTSGKKISIGMVDVTNDIEDSRIYDRSHLAIRIDGETVYDGALNDARWNTVLSAGDSILVTYDYSTDALEQVPDNSWMGAYGHWTYVFVGEVTSSSGGRSASSNSSSSGSGGSSSATTIKTPDTPSPDVPEPSNPDVTDPEPIDKRADITVVLPPTGDTSGLWAMIMGISGVCLVGLGMTMKRREKVQKIVARRK